MVKAKKLGSFSSCINGFSSPYHDCWDHDLCPLSLDHTADCPNQHGKSKLGKSEHSWAKLGKAETLRALLDRLQQVGAQLVIGLQGRHGYKL